MSNKKTNKFLDNFNKGKYSWNEYLQVKNMFDDSRNKNDLKNYMSEQLKTLIESDLPEDKSLDHIYKEIEYNILPEESKTRGKVNLWGFYKQIAAILLIPVLVFTGWYIMNEKTNVNFQTAWVEIVAPNSSYIQFSLPDGSHGWLNSGSSLKYNVDFNTKRQVNLKGEAFLEVEKSDVAFNVTTTNFDINVLGTSFNVSDFEDDSFSHIVLVEGKVQVAGQNQNFDQTLAPGERLFVDAVAGIVELDVVDIETLIAWKDGFFFFFNESFEMAAKRMERKYNVDLAIEDEVLQRYRINATFQDEPLEEALRLLSLSTPMEYKIERSNEMDHGDYQKKRVSLKLK